MNSIGTTQQIGALSMAVHDEMMQIGELHSCVLTAATLVEVLRRNGFRSAYALTVRAHIFNPTYPDWIKQRGFPKDQATLERCEAAGGASIGLGTGTAENTRDGHWPGYVAVIVPGAFGDRHAMSDMTITQADKLDWKIRLQPLILRVPEDFVVGDREFKPEVNGCLIVYKAFPTDRDFEKSVLWSDKDRLSIVADRVMVKI